MNKCIFCDKRGEKHHIVYKNQGGFGFEYNYVYLCFEHHRGFMGPHKNRLIDYELKCSMQSKLETLLPDEYYSLEDIKNILGLFPRQVKILENSLRLYKCGYKKLEIIKILMGNRLYSTDAK